MRRTMTHVRDGATSSTLCGRTIAGSLEVDNLAPACLTCAARLDELRLRPAGPTELRYYGVVELEGRLTRVLVVRERAASGGTRPVRTERLPITYGSMSAAVADLERLNRWARV